MLRSYWLPVIAIGLVLANTAYAESIRNSTSGHHPAERAQSIPKPDAPPSLPLAVQSDIHSIARSLNAANQKQPPATEEQREQKNLEAQQRMAEWAGRMFFVGLFEALITLAGVILVWRTLKATWRAAGAAENTLTAMKDTAARELRAYVGVTVEKQSFPEYGQPMHFKIGMKNHGQTPAYSVFQSINAKIFKMPIDLSEIYAEWPRVSRGVLLNPEQKTEVLPAIEAGWNDDIAKEIKEEKAAIFLWGEIRYLDIFDVWHVTRFMRLCYGTRLFGDGTFAYAINTECNDAN